ncbi:MAG: hypothetical protein NC308_09270, partial [Clostridium sp.]|nr:hypothetical protein [Clostridium sp.]
MIADAVFHHGIETLSVWQQDGLKELPATIVNHPAGRRLSTRNPKMRAPEMMLAKYIINGFRPSVFPS